MKFTLKQKPNCSIHPISFFYNILSRRIIIIIVEEESQEKEQKRKSTLNLVEKFFLSWITLLNPVLFVPV